MGSAMDTLFRRALLLSLAGLVLSALPASGQTPSGGAPAPVAAAPGATAGRSWFAVRDGLRIHLWQKCQAGQEAGAAKAGKVPAATANKARINP